MNIKLLGVALIAAGFVSVASARTPTVYTSARFVPAGDGRVELNGFGRGANSRLAAPSSFSSLADIPQRVNFFDTWNINTSDIGPGIYSFKDMLIDATGSLRFGTGGFPVTFNSIDESGERNTVLFDVTDGGKKATGSGTFTVRKQCPIPSCVWIDLTGTQDAGGGRAGYGGTVIATVVPEPATYGLLALGLAVVGAAARRRRAA